MAPIPQGAHRSENGYYWWDGTAWQQIPADERAASAMGFAEADALGGISQDELARVTSEEHLDERSKPYFQPDAGMYRAHQPEVELRHRVERILQRRPIRHRRVERVHDLCGEQVRPAVPGGETQILQIHRGRLTPHLVAPAT